MRINPSPGARLRHPLSQFVLVPAPEGHEVPSDWGRRRIADGSALEVKPSPAKAQKKDSGK